VIIYDVSFSQLVRYQSNEDEIEDDCDWEAVLGSSAAGEGSAECAAEGVDGVEDLANQEEDQELLQPQLLIQTRFPYHHLRLHNVVHIVSKCHLEGVVEEPHEGFGYYLGVDVALDLPIVDRVAPHHVQLRLDPV